MRGTVAAGSVVFALIFVWAAGVRAEEALEGDGVGRVVGSGPRGATTANVPAPPPVRLETQLAPGPYRVWGQIKRKGELYRTEELTVYLTEGGRNYVVLNGVCKLVRQRQ